MIALELSARTNVASNPTIMITRNGKFRFAHLCHFLTRFVKELIVHFIVIILLR
jgi:hypothetical protein